MGFLPEAGFPGQSETVRLLCICLSAIQLVLLVILAVLTIRRRALFPIRGRLWPLCILTSGLFAIALMNTIFDDVWGANTPMGLVSVWRYIGMGFAAPIYTLRAWQLLLSYRIVEKSRLLKEARARDEIEAVKIELEQELRSWLVRSRRSQSLCLHFGLLAMWLVGFSVITAIPQAMGVDIRIMTKLRLALILLTLVPGLLCSCKMRGMTPDVFFIRFEFKWMGYIIGSLLLVFLVGETFLEQGLSRRLTIVMILVVVAAQMFFQLLFPLYQSYKVEKLLAREAKMKLPEVLANPHLRGLFSAFLSREFCAENLEFYDEVMQFKHQCGCNNPGDSAGWTVAQTWAKARDICEDYVVVESPLKVYLSYATKARTVDKIERRDLTGGSDAAWMGRSDSIRSLNDDSRQRSVSSGAAISSRVNGRAGRVHQASRAVPELTKREPSESSASRSPDPSAADQHSEAEAEVRRIGRLFNQPRKEIRLFLEKYVLPRFLQASNVATALEQSREQANASSRGVRGMSLRSLEYRLDVTL